MSLLSFLACALDRHAPVRRNVAWNGLAYVGNCRHCEAAIQRMGHRNWRKVASKKMRETGT